VLKRPPASISMTTSHARLALEFGVRLAPFGAVCVWHVWPHPALRLRGGCPRLVVQSRLD